MSAPARFLPDLPLPPYAYVPGLFPHPISDPQGHSHGQQPAPVEPPRPDAWTECIPYLRGLDLFNHGYYWEAHEAWEALWHACGRSGPMADFFKGLIQLAVTGVKLRQGHAEGARWHARRAEELLASLSEPCLFGLEVKHLVACARQAQGLTPLPRERSPLPVEAVIPFRLCPR